MKRISPATVTFGVMAIVLGLVAAYIVRQAMQKPPVAKVVPPAPAPEVVEQIVCARGNIRANTRITEQDLIMLAVPKGTNPESLKGTLKNALLPVGRIAKRPIKAGLAVREEMMMAIGESLPDLAERLPPGHRALVIDVEDNKPGGKRVEDGDRVDIALTVEGTHPDLGEVQTRTLLTNVLVVDALEDRPLQRGTRRADGLVTDGLTVAVMPADANRLVVAQKTGTLSVSLRSAKEDPAAEEKVEPASRRELLGLREIPAPKIAEVKPAKKFTIEKYSGGKLEVIEFSGDRVRESRQGPSGKRFEEDDAATTQPISTPAQGAMRIPSGVKAPKIVAVEETEEVLSGVAIVE